LNYLNRDGQIDDYFATVYARFQQDVQQVKVWGKVYFKTVGAFWSDLFNGGNGITGVKEMYTGSSDPASPWYIDESAQGVNYYGYPVVFSETSTNAEWWNYVTANTLYETYMDMLQLPTMTINGYEHYWEAGGDYIKAKKRNATTFEVQADNFESIYKYGYVYVKHGFFVLFNWINPDGSPDVNGNIWKSSVQAIRKTTNSFNNNEICYHYGGYAVIDSSVDESDINYPTSVDFDDTTIGKTVDPTLITENDYVGTYINDGYVQDVEDLIMGIRNGTDTLVDTGVTMPKDTDYTQETTNPAIADVVGVQPVTAVAEVELDLPYVEEFELPATIINKFPFSIPWDLKRAVDMMQATAVVPVFEIPFVIPSINFEESITIDLNQFEYLAKIVRWFTLAIFMLGLIMATRGLIKG